ncbi:MAG: reactive intermediate/imine deaminase [candidate division Zixibacteria bacterium]|nr:reactive intermediate/imine deaminase [candidate division Zixibacteria bacterium]
MRGKVISTDSAPGAVGLYSQAVRVNGMVFCSGQIPIDPTSGQLVDGDAEKQATQIIENLKAVLESAGLGLEHVVKTTVYMVSLDDYAAVNEVYKKYFPKDPPARAAVAVRELPKRARLEIEAIAAE